MSTTGETQATTIVPIATPRSDHTLFNPRPENRGNEDAHEDRCADSPSDEQDASQLHKVPEQRIHHVERRYHRVALTGRHSATTTPSAVQETLPCHTRGATRR